MEGIVLENGVVALPTTTREQAIEANRESR